MRGQVHTSRGLAGERASAPADAEPRGAGRPGTPKQANASRGGTSVQKDKIRVLPHVIPRPDDERFV